MFIYRRCASLERDPAIDFWRAVHLMLKRYGEKTQVESARRADEFIGRQGSSPAVAHYLHELHHDLSASDSTRGAAGGSTQELRTMGLFRGAMTEIAS